MRGDFQFPEEFHAPESGKPCVTPGCDAVVPLEHVRTSGFCADCEGKRLAPDGWDRWMLDAIEVWKRMP